VNTQELLKASRNQAREDWDTRVYKLLMFYPGVYMAVKTASTWRFWEANFKGNSMFREAWDGIGAGEVTSYRVSLLWHAFINHRNYVRRAALDRPTDKSDASI
jgi:hypothetical protein